MRPRTRLFLDITAWTVVLGSVITLGLYCVGMDQFNEDRHNHRQMHHEGDNK